jgi:hypothetical protein
MGVAADAGGPRFEQCRRTMFETYRMLGRDHEYELEHLARTRTRSTKPRRLREPERHARRRTAALRLALAKLTAVAR